MSTLRDKLALIYTSAGSIRRTAGLVGISHQKVSRLLHEQYKPTSTVFKDAELKSAIDTALSIHKDITRQRASLDGLPYNASTPVYLERLPLSDGTPGDRSGVLHSHWLSNDQRNAWIAAMHSSGKFYALTISSIVNLYDYPGSTQNAPYNEEREKNKEFFEGLIDNADEKQIEDRVLLAKVHTKKTGMDQRLPRVLADVENQLASKHSPAVSAPGTSLASTMILQIDTRIDPDTGLSKDYGYRRQHPYPKRAASKHGKAKRAKKRAKRRR